jgi:carbon storage regulator CsrA
MLVLTRRIGEEIQLPGNVRLAVLAVQGDQVRLCITPPSSGPALGQELIEDRCEDAAEASTLCCPGRSSYVEPDDHPRAPGTNVR